MLESQINQLQEIINSSVNIVFFGGAGVSTASGIPDFRSQSGLFNIEYKYPPEKIVSRGFYNTHKEEFYKFYRDKILFLNAKPNAAHYKLADMEAAGKLKAVITQNIDGLHQAAGSKTVVELHGSSHRNYCQSCNKVFDAKFIKECSGVPICTCGGYIKPDVVLYEESLDMKAINSAVEFISNADVLIIGGTSLVVYPAAGMVEYFCGNKLIVINKTKTERQIKADLEINGDIAEIMGSICIDKKDVFH